MAECNIQRPSQMPSLVVFIRHIISEVLQYRRHPWWPYRARRHPWSHRGALHYVLFLLSTHRARRHPWWSLFATCPREGYADWTPDIGHSHIAVPEKSPTTFPPPLKRFMLMPGGLVVLIGSAIQRQQLANARDCRPHGRVERPYIQAIAIPLDKPLRSRSRSLRCWRIATMGATPGRRAH